MIKKSKMILGVIPARGGSKGVKGKNIRPLCGKPLIAYAIECGLKCTSIDNVLVTTDSRQIAEISKQYGADTPFLRPAELAEDTTPMLPVLQHAVIQAEKHYGKMLDCLVLIDPTGPLRIVDDIENALKLFRENDCDAVVSGNTANRNPYFNMVKVNDGLVQLVNEFYSPIGRRQDAPEVFDLNTVVWIYSRKALMEEKERLPKRSLLHVIPNERTVDLDTEMDLLFLEFLMNRNKKDAKL